MVALSSGDAAQALRRADSALLLDSSLAMAHLLAAMAAVKEQNTVRARKSAQNAMVALTKGTDPPPLARESRDDLLRACRAILGTSTPVPPNVRKGSGRRK
jgi:hypothetical protein